MKTSHLSIIFKMVIFGFLSTGCQKQIVEKQIVYQKEPVAQQGQMNEGGFHGGGGGNCIGENDESKCRPIESYWVKVDRIEVVEQTLLPAIEALFEIHPVLAGDLYHKLTERMWYFVPINLKKLPTHIIGAPVNIENLGQIALQNEQEVWMDDRLFKILDSEDQVRILLHELVMGVRLMEYSSLPDICVANATYLILAGQQSLFDKTKKDCYKDELPIRVPGIGTSRTKKIDLTDNDYQAIRTLTNWILEDSSRLSKVQLDRFLKDHFKRIYTSQP